MLNYVLKVVNFGNVHYIITLNKKSYFFKQKSQHSLMQFAIYITLTF